MQELGITIVYSIFVFAIGCVVGGIVAIAEHRRAELQKKRKAITAVRGYRHEQRNNHTLWHRATL